MIGHRRHAAALLVAAFATAACTGPGGSKASAAADRSSGLYLRQFLERDVGG